MYKKLKPIELFTIGLLAFIFLGSFYFLNIRKDFYKRSYNELLLKYKKQNIIETSDLTITPVYNKESLLSQEPSKLLVNFNINNLDIQLVDSFKTNIRYNIKYELSAEKQSDILYYNSKICNIIKDGLFSFKNKIDLNQFNNLFIKMHDNISSTVYIVMKYDSINIQDINIINADFIKEDILDFQKSLLTDTIKARQRIIKTKKSLIETEGQLILMKNLIDKLNNDKLSINDSLRIIRKIDSIYIIMNK